jgi:hypothetical protein
MYEYLHSVNLEELVIQQHGTPCAEGVVNVMQKNGAPRQSRRISLAATL